MKTPFLLLLIILIACQSTYGMADFYFPHHSEKEHMATQVVDANHFTDKLQQHQTNLKDLSHSCHHFCSASNLAFVEFYAVYPHNYRLAKQIDDHFKNKNHLWVILPKDIRPPIA